MTRRTVIGLGCFAHDRAGKLCYWARIWRNLGGWLHTHSPTLMLTPARSGAAGRHAQSRHPQSAGARCGQPCIYRAWHHLRDACTPATPPAPHGKSQQGHCAALAVPPENTHTPHASGLSLGWATPGRSRAAHCMSPPPGAAAMRRHLRAQPRSRLMSASLCALYTLAISGRRGFIVRVSVPSSTDSGVRTTEMWAMCSNEW